MSKTIENASCAPISRMAGRNGASGPRQGAWEARHVRDAKRQPLHVHGHSERTSTSVPQRFAQIFDVWGLNIYSGMAGTLSNYAQYVANGSDTQRPVIVSEWGVPGGVNVPPDAAGPPNGNA